MYARPRSFQNKPYVRAGLEFYNLKATMRPFFLVFVLCTLTVTLSLRDQLTYLHESLVGHPMIKIFKTSES